MMADTELDWPSEDVVPAGTDDDLAWLDADMIEAKKSGVPYDSLRFQCMRGSGRVWACDGEYVAYRPYNHTLDKHVNPAFQERVAKFREGGCMQHMGTFDEVEVYKLLDGNPWKATITEKYTAGKSLWGDIRHAAKLACARDWKDFTDLLEAMATGMKAGRDPEFARKAFNDALEQIMINIYQGRGPTPAECTAGMQNVRKSRGYSAGSAIIMPNTVDSKNVQYEGKQ